MTNNGKSATHFNGDAREGMAQIVDTEVGETGALADGTPVFVDINKMRSMEVTGKDPWIVVDTVYTEYNRESVGVEQNDLSACFAVGEPEARSGCVDKLPAQGEEFVEAGACKN